MREDQEQKGEQTHLIKIGGLRQRYREGGEKKKREKEKRNREGGGLFQR